MPSKAGRKDQLALPVEQGRRGRSISKLNQDLVGMAVDSLKAAGGVRYLKRQADENPAAYLSFIARAMPLQVKADMHSVEIVVHQVCVQPVPTPGVLASPVRENVMSLVVDNEADDAQAAD